MFCSFWLVLFFYFFFLFSVVVLFYLVADVSIIYIFPNVLFIFLLLFYFLCFVIVLLHFFFSFATPHSLQDFGSQAGGQAWAPVVGALSPNRWANRELQGILIRVRPPRGPNLGTKTWLYLTACKLQCWMPQAKQQVRQEYSLTHQKKWNDKKICYRRRRKVKTYKTK